MVYNIHVQGQIEDQYELDQRKDKFFKKAEYALVIVFSGIFYIAKLVLTVIWGVTKSVLKTLGLPIK